MRDFGTSSNDNWDGRGSDENEGGAQIPDFLMDPIGIVERRTSLTPDMTDTRSGSSLSAAGSCSSWICAVTLPRTARLA